jgi:hypothetical protein
MAGRVEGPGVRSCRVWVDGDRGEDESDPFADGSGWTLGAKGEEGVAGALDGPVEDGGEVCGGFVDGGSCCTDRAMGPVSVQGRRMDFCGSPPKTHRGDVSTVAARGVWTAGRWVVLTAQSEASASLGRGAGLLGIVAGRPRGGEDAREPGGGPDPSGFW